ncbi:MULTISPECIES: hypothetical protein [unclassified Tolypothrix]|uniref:hypothetical protein n=1 Tax=unclassified Tolypothrix TaxID=2649714 RepID=UPI0005EAC0E2|nr:MULTISPECIES: hypothetical protein [unclassified Tolypothrix]BAY88999.1 RDD domain-containing protein [Microchaete diplosiphon NIES-3275]EKF06143.1 hypothetical protein FDUTEX481_00079 [Tolypothrix sp. PCC 7601]MBE9080768.1 hypothetical protein [Tolypothrix sp. LEGE 11397]UYD29630.1 hypothetical protein HGR01_17375 [Tolypothrix sp. PCC 7712]UYD34454.1 hypothetical protein HG267_00905 [Tolypothrix sp. PCC 7601]
MKFKTTATLGILLISVTGLFGIESVDARNNSEKPSSSYKIAQVNSQITDAKSPIYGTFKLTYSVDGIVYESTLVMNGYSGLMKTRYYSTNTGKTEVVRQNMTLKSIPIGLFLIGSNPVYDKNSERANDYSPDNFLFSITPDGPIFYTCDRMERCSHVDLEVIK